MLEGRTTPNKPSIGKHANSGFRDRHFLPLVTIFWQISIHTSIEPNFIFPKFCIWMNIFCLDFKIRACNSATSILSRRACLLTRNKPEIGCLRFIQIWIMIFWDNLSNYQTILFHFCYRIPDSWEINFHRLSKCLTHVFVFTRTIYNGTIRGVI